MTVAETSKTSYKKIKENGKEKNQAEKVLEALRKARYLPTVNELNNDFLNLDIPNGRVHARLNKLQDEGKVTSVGERPDRYTGRDSKVWMTKTEVEQ